MLEKGKGGAVDVGCWVLTCVWGVGYRMREENPLVGMNRANLGGYIWEGCVVLDDRRQEQTWSWKLEEERNFRNTLKTFGRLKYK